MKLTSLVLLVLSCSGPLLFGASASAQSKGPDPYPAEPVVVVEEETSYRMAADGTGVHEERIVGRIQNEAALKGAGVLSVPFAGNSEHAEFVYVRVTHKDGTVTETPPSAALEVLNPVTREAPFYSDLKELQLPVRNLGVGDTVDWKARIVRTKPEAPGEFWGEESFFSGAVALSQVVELTVPKDKAVTVWSPAYKPVETVDGDNRTYRWTSSQLKPTVGPAADAEKEAKKKHVLTAAEELDQSEGKLPDIAWTTFKSWEAVGAWYRGLEGERMVPDADIKAKVTELTAGKATEQDKVQAVYGYVSENIRYIGVAFGVGRYQPHAANAVLENQYGDCKDKHTLLAAMLTALGEHPDAVLIGEGIRFNEAVPSPSAFNHLITRVTVDGKPTFLDATAEVAPYGMLNYSIRDKEALVVPENGPARLEKTPAKPPLAGLQKLEANGTLGEDGVSNSKFVLTFRGDEEVELRQALRQFSPSQYDEVVQKLVSAMSFGGTVSHAQISPVDDTTQPLTITFDYKRDKVGDWDNYRTLAQLMPTSLPRPDLKDPPVQTLNLGTPRIEISDAAMKLPAGWKVEFPEAVHEKCPYATFDVTYRFENGVMYSQRKVEVLQDKVPVSDWKTYSKWAEKVDLGDEQFIQLVRVAGGKGNKASASAGNGEGTTAPASNEDAGKLVTSAYNAIQQQKLSDAESLLDQAKELNPKQAWLWSTYGYLSFQRGEMQTAIGEYQKELELHPEALSVYAPLADAQYRVGRQADANKTLQTWVSLAPANPAAAERLVTFLVAEGKPGDAAAAAAAALPNLPEAETEPLRLQMGKAQFAAGMKDKGQATLVDLLRATENSGILNDAAYELADRGVELPLAETSARKAVSRLEEETRSWTLDENPQLLREKTNLLDASWDTLGWVLYREGKLDEARAYIEASWRGRQSAEVGKHLGDVAAAKGDTSAALGYYELAAATANPYGATKVQQAEAKNLAAKIAALRKAGTADPISDEGDALQKMRKISLGSAGGLAGVAEYKLLLSSGKIARAEPSGAKSLQGGVERLQKASLPGFIPSGSQANLVMLGMLNCHSGVCELVLEP